MEPLNSTEPTRNSIALLSINKTQDYAWGSKDKNCLVGHMTNQNLQTYA